MIISCWIISKHFKTYITINEVIGEKTIDLSYSIRNDDMIVPGMANHSFNIELTSTIDVNRTLVSHIGRAIVKKLKFEGNEIMSVDDFDVFACY